MRKLACLLLALAALLWPLEALAAPSFVSSGAVTGFTNSIASSAAYPASPVAGDFAFLYIATNDNGSSIDIPSAPAGWTRGGGWASGCCYNEWLFYKKLDGTETGSVSFTFTVSVGNGNAGSAVISFWHNVQQTGTPFEAAASAGFNNLTTSTAAGVTTTGADETVVTFWGLSNPANTTDPGSSTPGGWTNGYSDYTPVSSWAAKNIADYKAATSPASIPGPTRTFAVSIRGMALSLAILPGAAASAGHSLAATGAGS